jgi:hypothetical protein
MFGITTTTQLVIDVGTNQEIVTPTAVTGTTFTATFANTHAANTPVQGINSTVGATIIQVPGTGSTSGAVYADVNTIA